MDIAQLVAPYGDISTIKIVRDKQSRKSKGFAFVEMISEEAAREVMAALDNAEYREKVLTIKFATEPVAKPAPNFSRPKFSPRPVGREQSQNPNKAKRPRLK